MAYSFSGRVRYSEIGEDWKLTLPGVLNYFQDCSTFHSEAVGQGFQEIKKRNRFWVLGAWQVVIDEYPRLGDEIVTSTWAYSFKGFTGLRNFTIDSADGKRLARANSWWVYLDSTNGKPTRLLAEDTRGYEVEPRLEMDYEGRKIVLPQEMKAEESFAVQKHHLDTNHHVNNCQYVRMAMDCLPSDFRIRQMRTEYKQQARLHDIICPQTGENNGRITVSLNDENGSPYAVIEFAGE